MMENEAIYCLKADSELHSELCEECTLHGLVGCDHCQTDAIDVAIKALEEVQQYRKHGVTLESALNNMCDLAAAENLIEEYRAIGTPEECRAAMEKQPVFNMDKVVEQLEKEFKKYYGKNWNKVPYLVKVIEIVQGSEARDVVTR